MGAPEHQHGPPLRQSEPDLVQGFTRLEQQVAFNYNMIQGHHQDVARITEAVGRLQHEMRTVIGFMDEMRNDLRSGRFPPRAVDQGRYDPADVEVLANQIASVTTKANEVDNLKTQIELMKQRLKRFESQSATNAPGPQSEAAAARADQKHHDAMRAQQGPGQPLPSMRPGVPLSSEHGRQPTHPSAAPPVLESQPVPGFHSAQERQPNATDQAQQAARQPGFRAAEPLPPSNAMSSWRPAGPSESYPPGGPTPPTHSHPLRSHPPESEPQATGWAAVNLNQGPKRSIDEHHPTHDSSQPGSPKRPKLAPLKPRSSFGDEHHHHSPYAQPVHMDAAHQARGRIPSGDVPIQPHSQLNPAPVPGQGATNSYRFITSTVTGQPDGQEHWRAADGDSGMSARFENSLGGAGRGRGRGSRGGGRRGGRGRGGRSSSGAPDVPPTAPEASHQEQQVHAMQVPPEWREHQWASQQAATNGHFPGQHAFSPIEAARPAAADLAVHTVAPPHGLPYPAGHEHEFPATPIASSADPYGMANDLDSANKKTRTKPIRNSDGVLIRKDGRPDMRSVSSANNLRKVHAKKEAEKAEMEGRTPTSGRSLQPNNSASLSDDEGMEEGDYMDDGDMERERMVDSEGRTVTPGTQQDAEHSETVMRHRELMNRMFNEGPKGTAEAWFPRAEAPPLDVKREDHENKEREARWRGMEDTAMRDSERPEVSREVSQRPSEPLSREPLSREPLSREPLSREPLSREQTSIEVVPSNAVASEPTVSEQPESEAGTGSAKAPEPRALSSVAAEEGEKDAAKKDSTQLKSSAERVANEPMASASAV
jgi:uncharacterized coiled-coil protein SlyX